MADAFVEVAERLICLRDVLAVQRDQDSAGENFDLEIVYYDGRIVTLEFYNDAAARESAYNVFKKALIG